MSASTNELNPQYDITGKDPQFRRVSYSTVTSINDGEFNIIIPTHTPFYGAGLSIEKLTTKEVLQYGKDYLLGGYYPELSKHTLHQNPLYGVIVLINPDVGGSYKITYQYFGGEEKATPDEVVRILTNHRFNPFTQRWVDIIGRPMQYVPKKHMHNATDTDSYQDMIDEFRTMNQTLASLIAENHSDKPSIIQLITEQLELQDSILDLNSRVDSLNRLLTGTTQSDLKNVATQVGELSTNLTNLTAKLQENKDVLSRNITSVNQTLTELITTKISEVNDSIEEARSALRNTIGDVDSYVARLEERLDTRNETQDGEITKVKEKITQITNNYNASLKTINGKIDRLQNTLSSISSNFLAVNNPTGTGTLTIPTVKTTVLKSDTNLDIRVPSGNNVQIKRGDDILFTFHGDRISVRKLTLINETDKTITHNISLTKSGDILKFTIVPSKVGFKTHFEADDFTTTNGKVLSHAVMDNGAFTGYLMSAPFKETAVASLLHCGAVARSVSGNVNGKRFFNYGIQYSATSGSTKIIRMLAFDDTDPFKVHALAWDNNLNYLGSRLIGGKIRNNFNQENDESAQVPSMQLFRTVSDKIAPTSAETHIADGYDKAPVLSRNNGLNINSKLRMHLDGTGTNKMGVLSLVPEGSAVKFRFDNQVEFPNFTITSDERLKHDIRDYDISKGDIRNITTKTFKRWLDGVEHEYVGLVAQDVQKEYPELVKEGNDGYLSIDYQALSSTLVGIVGNLLERIEKLENKG